MIDKLAIAERLQPLLDRLAADICLLVPVIVREQLVAAIGELAGDVAELPRALSPPPARPRKGKHPTKRAKGQRQTCRKCGKPGHNAKTCRTSASKIVFRPDPPAVDMMPAIATPATLSPPPISFPASLSSRPRPPAEKLPGPSAPNGPPPSFDAAEDQAEEMADLSFLTISRKTSFR